MSTFTRDNTEISFKEDGVGQQNRAEDGGMIIALEQWNAGLDTAEMFADLPDGACQEGHWGYVLKGRCTVRYTDGESETLSTGEAYYTSAQDTTSTSTRTRSSSSSRWPTARPESTPRSEPTMRGVAMCPASHRYAATAGRFGEHDRIR